MELASESLPSRAPMQAPAEHQSDPWSDFLQRVLPSPLSAGRTDAAAAQQSDATLPEAAGLSVE